MAMTDRELAAGLGPRDVTGLSVCVDCASVIAGAFGEPRRDINTGREIRPAGFTGNAEKLHYGQRAYYPIWWEPPKDIKRSDPTFSKFRQIVQDLLDFGYKGVILEVLEGKDAYRRDIVTKSASLWGIDSLENGYLLEVVAELAAELGL